MHNVVNYILMKTARRRLAHWNCRDVVISSGRWMFLVKAKVLATDVPLPEHGLVFGQKEH